MPRAKLLGIPSRGSLDSATVLREFLGSVRIALDATYSIDPFPSGMAVYSQRILAGLAERFPHDFFVHCYRPKQLVRSFPPNARNIRRVPLLNLAPTFRAPVFHALNQRLDKRYTRHVVSTFHDLFVMTGEYSTPEFRARFTKQARSAAKNSDVIIAVSEFTADQVSQLLAVPRSRIRVIPHGADAPSSASLSSQREKIILFVGALQKRKNVARLVEAFEALPQSWRLVLAGAPSGFAAHEVLDRIDRSSARERISIEGYVSNERLGYLYSIAGVFAFPSLDEGFGIPVLEAMAHGVPVATSSGSALREIGAGAAIFVDPYSTESIASGLKLFIEDEALRNEYSRRGIERARLFPWDRAVDATNAVYRELVGE